MATKRTERLVKRVVLWGGAALLLLMAVSLGFSTWRVYTKLTNAREGRVYAEEERNKLLERTKELAASLEALETDRGLEAEIRSRYPVVMPGEVEIILVDPPTQPVDTATTTRESIWGRFRNWLGF